MRGKASSVRFDLSSFGRIGMWSKDRFALLLKWPESHKQEGGRRCAHATLLRDTGGRFAPFFVFVVYRGLCSTQYSSAPPPTAQTSMLHGRIHRQMMECPE